MTKTVTLGEICKLEYGKSLIKEGRQEIGPYPVYGSSGIVGYHDKYITKGPCLIVGRKGSVGALHYSETACWPIDTVYYIHEEGIDHKFLYYQLSTLRLKDLDKSTSIPGINRNDAYQKQLILPSLPEQRRIAALLDRADALRQKDRQLLAHYDQLAQSLFLDMFGDPVKNEKGWDEVKLGAIAKIERGRFSPRPRNDPSYYGGQYPFIQTGDISGCNHRLSQWHQTLNEKGIKVSKQFKKGTIVVAIVGATIGASAILEIDSYAPDSVVGIQANQEVTSQIFIEFVLRRWRPIFLEKAPDSARANINLETFKPLSIYLPPLSLQTQFAQLIEQIEKQKEVVRRQIAASEALFGRLLQQCFG